MTITSTAGADCKSAAPRRLFMVLSPRSLPYASLALSSLFRNAEEPFDLRLITDSAADKETLEANVQVISDQSSRRNWSVLSSSDLDEPAAEKFALFRNLQAFRLGHPCWRKITDPLLLSSDDQEMIVLDPDLYFPNRFCFENTPSSGVLLMWQKPSCLLPPEVVQNAMRANIALAHHTDIGVAHWRMPVDLQWLDWLIGKLGAPNLPRSMHVESIVWAALAMRIGGGYLDHESWRCWHRSQLIRISRKLGASGASILAKESWATIKCFHGGGEAKWWIPEAFELGKLTGNASLLSLKPPLPFTELTPGQFSFLEQRRSWLRKAGYYSFFD